MRARKYKCCGSDTEFLSVTPFGLYNRDAVAVVVISMTGEDDREVWLNEKLLSNFIEDLQKIKGNI